MLLTIAVLLMLPQIQAMPITADQAKTVAHNFYFERFDRGQQLDYDDIFVDEVFSLKIKSEIVIYFMNFIEGGWVAVSVSDAVVPIVAYSFDGSYGDGEAPANFSSWITQYKKQISFAIAQNIQPTPETKKLWSRYLTNEPHGLSAHKTGRNVEPLLTTTWNQGMYYNEMCPADPAGPGGHCYAGCVPTAMGQVCNYFRFPPTGTGSYSYQCPPYGELSADFENSNYDWDGMPVNVSGSSLATAQLLYHLGVSCDLVYGPNGSGMYNHKAAYALRTHFKYSPETQYVFRDSTNMDWDSLLVSHLDRKMPMYYAGWSVLDTNGHAFVCDGYQDSSYFHFNWGWGGSYDGYFYTGNLSPGGSNFNLAQEVIINCFPDTNNYQYPAYCQGADTLRSVTGSLEDGSGPVYDYADNLNCTWFISPADSVNSITLDFLRFDTRENDTLHVYDGSSNSAQLIGSFSGSGVPSSLTSSSDELFIEFSTDSENVAGGWLIGYSSSIPQYCSNLMFTLPADTISDGSGPANYHNLTTCLWMIQPGDGLDITLSFTEFSTEEGHDLVKVYDGNDKIGEFSGSSLPPDLTAHSGSMFVFFSTNSSVTDKGWDAHYSTSPMNTEKKDVTDKIKVFPNPANNRLNIELPRTVAFAEVCIYDIYGKKVVETGGSHCSSITVNTSGLPEGIYFIKISSDDNTVTKKVIIAP